MEHSTYSRVVRDKVDDILHHHHQRSLTTAETILYALPFILIPNILGIAGAFFTRPRLESWYRTLRKPWFTPPNWVFSVVWPTLYCLIGYATFIVWRDAGGFWARGGRLGLHFSVINIILNSLWSPVFFGFGLINLAFLLHVAIYTTAWLAFVGFLRVSGTAATLYFPYLLWLTYAGAIQLWMVMYSSSQVADEQRKKHIGGATSGMVSGDTYGATADRTGGISDDSTISKRTTTTATSAAYAPKTPGL